MAGSVHVTSDVMVARRALASCFEPEPVTHNVVYAALMQPPELNPGSQFWWIETQGVLNSYCAVIGDRPAVVWAADPDYVAPLLDAVHDSAAGDPDLHLTGMTGRAGLVAEAAADWSARWRLGARVASTVRYFTATDVVDPPTVPGELRIATVDDLDLVHDWAVGFQRDVSVGPPPTSAPSADAVATLRARLTWKIEAGEVALWVDDAPRAMAWASTPAGGVTRIHGVYTPPHARRRGLAAACTAALVRRMLDRADVHTCTLFTELDNATTNALYPRIGFRAHSTHLNIEFVGLPVAPPPPEESTPASAQAPAARQVVDPPVPLPPTPFPPEAQPAATHPALAEPAEPPHDESSVDPERSEADAAADPELTGTNGHSATNGSVNNGTDPGTTDGIDLANTEPVSPSILEGIGPASNGHEIDPDVDTIRPSEMPEIWAPPPWSAPDEADARDDDTVFPALDEFDVDGELPRQGESTMSLSPVVRDDEPELPTRFMRPPSELPPPEDEFAPQPPPSTSPPMAEPPMAEPPSTSPPMAEPPSAPPPHSSAPPPAPLAPTHPPAGPPPPVDETDPENGQRPRPEPGPLRHSSVYPPSGPGGEASPDPMDRFPPPQPHPDEPS
ncbi:MAG: GNAT family N-acetyltransferase [Actinomycetota bacterium]